MSSGPILAPAIPMSIYQISVLKELQNKQRTGQQQVIRINIVLMAHGGFNNSEIARALKIALNTVKTWRSRWLLAYNDLMKGEANLGLDKITSLVLLWHSGFNLIKMAKWYSILLHFLAFNC